jgi:hypothetical protein
MEIPLRIVMLDDPTEKWTSGGAAAPHLSTASSDLRADSTDTRSDTAATGGCPATAPISEPREMDSHVVSASAPICHGGKGGGEAKGRRMRE